MYKTTRPAKTSIKTKKPLEGETIEKKVQRILNNKEPITDGAPLIYTERKDGVLPEYDVRTDRFEEALGMTGKIHKMKIAERESRHKPAETGNSTDSGAETGANSAPGAAEPQA